MKTTTKALTTAIVSICVLVLMAFAISFTMVPTNAMKKNNTSCVSVWEPETGESTLSHWGENSSKINVPDSHNRVVLYLKFNMKDMKVFIAREKGVKATHVKSEVKEVIYLGDGIYKVVVTPNDDKIISLVAGYSDENGDQLALKTTIKVVVKD
mgnify:FL=1